MWCGIKSSLRSHEGYTGIVLSIFCNFFKRLSAFISGRHPVHTASSGPAEHSPQQQTETDHQRHLPSNIRDQSHSVSLCKFLAA